MTYIQSLKFRSFAFYSNRSSSQFKRNFISGRAEKPAAEPVIGSQSVTRYESWWRTPKYKKNYSSGN
ncbi:TPA: hypothetical protein DIC39_03315 [Patescibacteria group bacterium]|nr:hypothetical protein [Patescibacteria group bacterium]HCU48057.1 hypothetical protein [Patescibacteria group bacterium]